MSMEPKLKYDRTRFKKAFLTVFGKTLICRDIDVASQYSKSANMDCVTLCGNLMILLGGMRWAEKEGKD